MEQSTQNRAVVVLEPNSISGLHIGLSIPRDNGDHPALLVHLAWHNKLVATVWHPLRNQTLVMPNLTELEDRYLRASVRLIIRKNNLFGERIEKVILPYGFSNYIGWLTEGTGTIQLPTDGVGLTCATFVLALFSNALIELVQPETWPSRSDDRRFQEQILSYLTRQFPQHAAQVKTELGRVRVRPEEVAVASTYEDKPVAFSELFARKSQDLFRQARVPSPR